MVEKRPEFKEIYKNGAFAQDTLYKNGILFLGVVAAYFDGCEVTCDVHGPVQYETKRGRIGEETDEGRIVGYKYYNPMIKLAKETGFDYWSNIDITLFRETSQKKLVPFFRKFPDIMEEQLKLATKMIIATEPKIIIVSNALVRDVLNDIDGKYNINSDFCFDEDEEFGTPRISSPKELKGIPVFFTSMLSGAGALDKGSFKRLIWHIKFVKGKM
jgi:hypothetical protein